MILNCCKTPLGLPCHPHNNAPQQFLSYIHVQVSYRLKNLAQTNGPDAEDFKSLADAVEDFAIQLLEPLKSDDMKRAIFEADDFDRIWEKTVLFQQKKFVSHPVVYNLLMRRWAGSFYHLRYKPWMELQNFKWMFLNLWTVFDVVLFSSRLHYSVFDSHSHWTCKDETRTIKEVEGGGRRRKEVEGGRRWKEVEGGGRRWRRRKEVEGGGRRREGGEEEEAGGGRRWKKVEGGGRRWKEVEGGGRRWKEVEGDGRKWDNAFYEWSYRKATTIRTYNNYHAVPVPFNIISLTLLFLRYIYKTICCCRCRKGKNKYPHKLLLLLFVFDTVFRLPRLRSTGRIFLCTWLHISNGRYPLAVETLTTGNLLAIETLTTGNPLAIETLTTGNPLAVETLTTGNPLAIETLTTGNPLAVETLTTGNPLAIETLTTGNPLAVETLTTGNPLAIETLTTGNPLAVETLTTGNPLAIETLTTGSPLAVETLTTESNKMGLVLRETEGNRQLIGHIANQVFKYGKKEAQQLTEDMKDQNTWDTRGVDIRGHQLTYVACNCSECVQSNEGEQTKFHGARFLKPLSKQWPGFEVLIQESIERRLIAIGVVTGEWYNPHMFPGWYGNSAGYHVDEAKIFDRNNQKIGIECDLDSGGMAHRGDLIGCKILYDRPSRDHTLPVSFTLNGRVIGEATITNDVNVFYPFVGIGWEGITLLFK
ncbi:hypothetical protein QZH41_018091, partial [Actinostola sp. cb2023]